MSGYKSFGVIGAGNIGSWIIDGLLREKANGKVTNVTVITRSNAQADHPDWVSKGAKFAVTDYDSDESLKSAFEGVDVLISTISASVIPKQLKFATVASAAGVQLFLPSEFGIPTDKATQGIFLAKKQVQDKCKELNLPYSLIFTGFWTDTTFIPLFGFDFENGTVDIGGKGETPITFTSREDVIRFILHVLLDVPKSTVEWSKFALEGERVSLKDVIARYEAKTGKKITVSHTPLSTLQENLSKNEHDIVSLLKVVWDTGLGVVGTPTDVWPEWNPKKVLEVLAP